MDGHGNEAAYYMYMQLYQEISFVRLWQCPFTKAIWNKICKGKNKLYSCNKRYKKCKKLFRSMVNMYIPGPYLAKYFDNSSFVGL